MKQEVANLVQISSIWISNGGICCRNLKHLVAYCKFVTCQLELRSPRGWATHGEPGMIQRQVQPSQGEECSCHRTTCLRTYRGFEDEEGAVPAKNENY
jgi:hypothetical protein